MLHLDFTAESQETNPLEIALLMDCLSNILMWIFFIVVALGIFKITFYIKKNASGGKHS